VRVHRRLVHGALPAQVGSLSEELTPTYRGHARNNSETVCGAVHPLIEDHMLITPQSSKQRRGGSHTPLRA